MKVLVADDDPLLRAGVEELLSESGYEVTSVKDGGAALEVLCAPSAPQIAVLDWMMPEMNGTDVCRRLREKAPTVPVYLILVTALGQKENLLEGLRSGADDYLTKPFDCDELLARIKVGQRVLQLENSLAQRVDELQAALSHIKRLQGILPICMHCHQIRNDGESWQQLEQYITEHSDAVFSHGLCPDCLARHYPGFASPPS